MPALALWCFRRYGLWLSMAVPLLIQLPMSWLVALLWLRSDLLNERKRILTFIRRVFPQWIPFVSSSPGQWYPDKGAKHLTSERNVGGLCLATDIEGYTSDCLPEYTSPDVGVAERLLPSVGPPDKFPSRYYRRCDRRCHDGCLD